jgi:hypothetical protein
VKDQVSHPYKTTGKIIVLYTVTWKNTDRRKPRYLEKHLFHYMQAN